MRLSDLITEEIIKLLNSSEDNTAEIQRNEFAGLIGCVPSQINYVLSSRFTPEHGYIIESRRGGGGYIRIKRVSLNRSSAVMHIINSLGVAIDAFSARILIENCLQSSLINAETARIFKAVVADTALRTVPIDCRDELRAALLKQMFLTLL